ncbi:MAG: acyl-CoA dehydrogenase [Pseudomonas sp.]|nr:acyl-CoA dehydrogenase [Pseudomonas sp.]
MQEPLERLESALSDFARRPNAPCLEQALQHTLHTCLQQGLDQLPLPGAGQTLLRWQRLAAVASVDLSLLKLFEGHTDALAILAELGSQPFSSPGLWAVWAAEPPAARVQVTGQGSDPVHLNGTKAWCSGAQQVDYALLTAWDEHAQPQLVAVTLHQPGVRVGQHGWQAVGMASTASVDVQFEHAVGLRVGAPGEYLSRPGFWQGGAGIAAAWYGAAMALARALLEHRRQARPDAHADAHLGAVDAALCGAAASLRECAAWIDAHPRDDARLAVQRLRAQVESAVEQVCRHVGRALGATPYCRDAHFARLAADLPVFIRQSHAERDLAQLGQLVSAGSTAAWSL